MGGGRDGRREGREGKGREGKGGLACEQGLLLPGLGGGWVGGGGAGLFKCTSIEKNSRIV